MGQAVIHVSFFEIVNASKWASDEEVAQAVEGIRQELPRFAAAWGVPVPGIAMLSHPVDQGAASGSVGDDNVVQGADGEHTTVGPRRILLVDAHALRGMSSVAEVLSHEVFETAANPDLLWTTPYPNGNRLAKETCDPVQLDPMFVTIDWFGTRVDVPVSNYVLPSWFNPSTGGPWDAKGTLTGPLTRLPTGYIESASPDGAVSIDGFYKPVNFGRAWELMHRPPMPC